MTSNIDLIKFKNILSENKIELFDYDLRISHHRLCNYIINRTQTGGSTNSSSKTVSDKLNNMSQIHLSHLVNSLLDKNEHKTNWIFNLY